MKCILRWSALLLCACQVKAYSPLATVQEAVANRSSAEKARRMRFAPSYFVKPTFQSLAFFNEIGPLIVGLLVAGRVGAGIGAELADMRVTEQIDAIDAFSIDSFKLLVVQRVIACIVALPLLTVFMDVAGLTDGYLVERGFSHSSWPLYISRAFSLVTWASFIPPTLKTTVFGLIIGLISCYFGYTTNEDSAGVGRASTNSVALSSLLIILADVVLVKAIVFLFPDSASLQLLSD